MAELAGMLSERVRFEGRDDMRGSAGAVTAGWTERFACWAAVEVLRRAEMSVLSGDTLHGRRRFRLTLRDGVSPLFGMQIVWRGQRLAVTGVEADPRAGRIIVWAEDAPG